MIKYKIQCGDCESVFNSWFASSEDFEKIKKSNLLNCSMCNSLNVDKSLMAPNLSKTKKNQADTKIQQINEIRKNLKKYQKFIEKNYSYVGNDFAYEARTIHYNNKKDNKLKKGIFGNASKKEIEELKDEGIETETIPWITNKEN